jgi:hypothetical protein
MFAPKEWARRASQVSAWVVGSALLLMTPFAFLGWVNGRSLDVHRADIAMLQIQPIPEGAVGEPYSRTGQKGTLPLSQIERYIPDPLPHSVWQGFPCHIGGDLIVTLTDGRAISYGPCRYPRSITVMWANISDATRAISQVYPRSTNP